MTFSVIIFVDDVYSHGRRTPDAECGRCASVCCTDAITPAATDMTVDEVVATVLRDKAFYGDNGGITVSGGEPMTHPVGVIALLTACKEAGITTCVETCGEFSPTHLPVLCGVTDLFLWDVKDTDPIRHKAYTGVDNTRILQNLKENRRGKTTILSAHRISTLQQADQILVLDDGAVIGQGTHEELLASCETYREIYKSQMGLELSAEGAGK